MDFQYGPLPDDFIGLRGVEFSSVTAPTHQEIALNHLNPYFGSGKDIPGNAGVDNATSQADARLVRQAMSHIVDREFIVDSILDGLGQAAASPVPPASLGWDSSVTPDAYDIMVARNLMEQAGFNYSTIPMNGFDIDDSCGLTGDTANCFYNITVLSPNSYPARNQWAELYVETLPKIGIGVDQHVSFSWDQYNVVLWGLEEDTLIPEYNEGGYDMFFLGHPWGLDWDPGNEYSIDGLCDTGDCSNFNNFANVTMSNLINDYRVDFNGTSRQEKVSEIQKLLAYQKPVIPIAHPQNTWSWAGDVLGIDMLLISVAKQEWGNVRRASWVEPATPADPQTSIGEYCCSGVPGATEWNYSTIPRTIKYYSGGTLQIREGVGHVGRFNFVSDTIKDQKLDAFDLFAGDSYEIEIENIGSDVWPVYETQEEAYDYIFVVLPVRMGGQDFFSLFFNQTQYIENFLGGTILSSSIHTQNDTALLSIQLTSEVTVRYSWNTSSGILNEKVVTSTTGDIIVISRDPDAVPRDPIFFNIHGIQILVLFVICLVILLIRIPLLSYLNILVLRKGQNINKMDPDEPKGDIPPALNALSYSTFLGVLYAFNVAMNVILFNNLYFVPSPVGWIMYGYDASGSLVYYYFRISLYFVFYWFAFHFTIWKKRPMISYGFSIQLVRTFTYYLVFQCVLWIITILVLDLADFSTI